MATASATDAAPGRPPAPPPCAPPALGPTPQQVLDSIVAHGIAVLDIDGRVLQWNAGAERTSGHRAADIVGRHVSLLYPAEAIAAGTPQRELDAAHDGDGAAIEGERIRADGRRFWAEIALSPVRDAAGTLQGFALLMRDLSARRVAQRQHDEAALRLRAIVDTAVDGVITINERGVMESANRAAERLFGWRAAEMIGRNVSMLMPQPDRGAHDGYLRRYKVTGERRIIGIGREVLGQRRDGTTFPMELAVSETPLPDGRRIFTGLVRDVSDRKRIEAELLAADRRKDEFLAVLAHELRNPLAPIANALQVLKLAAGQPEHVNSLREVMERQTRQLVRLIDDLMDVSRITSGKLALRRGRVQLADIVATAVETSRSAIDAAGHRLVVDLPEAAVWLDVDPLRIAQVFSNLLANAARYTPPGGRLSLSARSDGARVQVEVSDNGIGIPAAGLARVFEMFAQVNEAQARAAGGLGIGLALVRSLVEMHGGSVTAHSAGPGCGASFVVTLPVAAPASAQDGDAQQTAALPGSLRVLVVDDNLDAADTLAMLLRIMNHHVELAHDGVDAIAVAARLRPALILMDISMPRMDGLEATRTIRAEPWGRQAFICTLTGLGQEQDRARSSAAGVDAHLVKPVAPDELQAILAHARARHAGAAG